MMIYYLRSDNRIALHPLKIVILEIFHFIAAPFSSLCFFFCFADWEKSKRAHNFHPITRNVRARRSQSGLMNRANLANDKIYNITLYGHRRRVKISRYRLQQSWRGDWTPVVGHEHNRCYHSSELLPFSNFPATRVRPPFHGCITILIELHR